MSESNKNQRGQTARLELILRRLQTIHDEAIALNSGLLFEEILQRACEAVCEIFDADHSQFVLYQGNFSRGVVEAEYPALGLKGTSFTVQGDPILENHLSARTPLSFDIGYVSSFGLYTEILYRFDIQSILIVPVLAEGELLGSFSLDGVGRTRVFTEDEVGLAQVLSAHLAVALRNALYLADANEKIARLEIINQAALTLMSQSNAENIQTIIVQQAVYLFAAQGASLYQHDPEREELALVATFGEFGVPAKVGESVTHLLSQRGLASVIIDNLEEWQDKDSIRRLSLKEVAVPLIYAEQIVGVLQISDSLEREFTQEDVGLLERYAKFAAAVLATHDFVIPRKLGVGQILTIELAIPYRTFTLEKQSRFIEELAHAVQTSPDSIYILSVREGSTFVMVEMQDDAAAAAFVSMIFSGSFELKDFPITRVEITPGITKKEVINVPIEIERYDGTVEVEEINLGKLREFLANYFNLTDIQDICFDLGVDYESLPGDGKRNKARELVSFLKNRGRIGELVSKCRSFRPNINVIDVIRK